jgi:5-formyltetrahydrofolate cyclo-ligase
MRTQRASLPAAERNRVARAIAHHLERTLLLRPGKRIAIYVAVQGEVSLAPLIRKARQRHCKLFIPQIASFRQGRMHFVALHANQRLRRNRYGLLENHQRTATPVAPGHLDMVLTPLVAFDAHGWRLGMGAGFYDRRFAFLKNNSAWRRPKLIGVAYSFQQVASLTPQPWDVPLDAVVTEKGLMRTR